MRVKNKEKLKEKHLKDVNKKHSKKESKAPSDTVQKACKKRNYRKRFLYSEAALNEAISCCKSGSISLNKASKHYNIPVGTLFNKVHGKVPLKTQMGPKTVLTVEEETRIKNWILDKAKIGHPMHYTTVREAVKSVLDKVQRPNPFKNNYPGIKWIELFLKRHPEIKAKNTEVLSRTRAAVTEEKIRKWFEDVKLYLSAINALDVLEDPSRIFNMDETGVALCPKTSKVLVSATEKNVYSISPGAEKQNITVLCCFGASGVGIRPMIMYPYKRSVPSDIVNSVPDGYAIGKSDNGWMSTAAFYEYIVNCFYPKLIQNQVKFPVILFLDGHKSHISLELHDFCVEHRIILYCFVAHASHVMQPADVGVFKPLKVLWAQAVSKHAQDSNKPLTKSNFALVFDQAYSQILKKTAVIKKGFEKSEIFPFDADKVDYSKCISSRRKLMTETIQSDNITENGNITDNTSIVQHHIEEHIPVEVLKSFKKHLLLGTVPSEEKILFSVWKQTQQPSHCDSYILSDSEVSLDNSNEAINSVSIFLTPPDNSLGLISEKLFSDNSQLPSQTSQKNISKETNIISETDILDVDIEFIDLNLINADCLIDDSNKLDRDVNSDENVNQVNNIAKVVDVTDKFQSYQDSSTFSSPIISSSTVTMSASLCALPSSSKSQSPASQSNLSMNDSQNSENKRSLSPSLRNINNGIKKICTSKIDAKPIEFLKNSTDTAFSSHNYSILDLSNKPSHACTFSTPALERLPLKDITANTESSIPIICDRYKNPFFNKNAESIVSSNIKVKQELLVSTQETKEYVDSVWKEQLHFPRIDASKCKKSRIEQAPIYALTSEQWKLKISEQNEKDEKAKNDKLIKKEEREKLRTIKMEEVEEKKKLKASEREQKIKLKKEEQENKQKIKEEKDKKKQKLNEQMELKRQRKVAIKKKIKIIKIKCLITILVIKILIIQDL